MGFLDKLGQMLKAHPDTYLPAANLLERFDPVDGKELEESGEAMLSFLREHCIRGNARKFRIFLDDREVYRIGLDAQCGILCPPGFHRLYVKRPMLTILIRIYLSNSAGRWYRHH